jgi:hypothetical protein
MEVVAVEMNDVETGYIPKYQFHHQDVMGQGFANLFVAPEGVCTRRFEARARHGISAGE